MVWGFLLGFSCMSVCYECLRECGGVLFGVVLMFVFCCLWVFGGVDLLCQFWIVLVVFDIMYW